MRTVEGRHCIVPTQECLRSDGGWRLDPRPASAASAASSGEAEQFAEGDSRLCARVLALKVDFVCNLASEDIGAGLRGF